MSQRHVLLQLSLQPLSIYLQEKQNDIVIVSASAFVRGMGFASAPTISGHRTGVQVRLRMLSLFAVFIHRRSHMLQLACIQAAHQALLVKRVYSNLTICPPCRKHFSFPLKRRRI